MPDQEQVPVSRTMHVHNLLKKWGPGKDPATDQPDEVIEWEGPEDVPLAALQGGD